MNNYIEEYNEKIQSGKIVACKKLKEVYKHIIENMHNDNLKYEYDDSRAQAAIDFIESFCIIPKYKDGRQPFKLQLWQKALISVLFGFVDKKSGYRQYREVFLFVGRKNSKSVLSAAISVYLMVADGENAPEIYSAASDRRQAKIIWEYSSIMINSNNTLKKYLHVMSHEIKCSSNFGKFVPLSKNSGSFDGLNPSLILIDELHSIKDRNMYDVLKGGTYSRQQPLTFITSTGGFIQKDSIFDIKYEEYSRLIKGYKDNNYKDETTIAFVYEIDDKKEIFNEENWIKANPNLGISKSIEQLRVEVNRARLDEKTKADLLVKQFNFRESSIDLFFGLKDVQNELTFDIENLRGSYFIGGVDLSETTDLSCGTALIYKDENLYVLQKYFLPEQTLKEHEEKENVPYSIWRDRGYLETCEGNMIEQRQILDWFLHLQDDLGLYPFKIGYDPWRAPYLTQELENNFGSGNIIKVSQSLKNLSEPMYSSKALFKSGKINYNKNPLFLYCLLNVQAKSDVNGNIQPCKNRHSNKRIDGYSSFLTALCTYYQFKTEYEYL